MMRRLILTAMAAVWALCACAGLTFSGNTLPVIDIKPEASTGLNNIYVLNAMGGVTATYTAASADAAVTWYRYSSLGGGYAEEVGGVSHQGREWTLSPVEGDLGYIIEEGTSRYYCWIVDYSRHRFSVSGVDFGPEQECDLAAIIPQGYGDAIHYYTINGRQAELDREITVSWTTLEYDEEGHVYRQAPAQKQFASLSPIMRVPAPLCDTRFTISGDRFLSKWGDVSTAESGAYKAVAVAAETTATAAERDNDNEQMAGDGSGLGGSAPAEITFEAVVTDAVEFKEWQFSRNADFDVIDLRMNQLDVTYTFVEQGTTYVRFVAANAAGSCDAYGQVYEVFIGDSALECPNAFSPGASEGVNDEWKVSYKSIVEFECHIFNKWGAKMTSFTDPSQGWDGRYNGKLVPAGVYYYVIKAKGADGRKYDLAGDINIVNFK